ncbi:MAG: T9SS type A sorting domain-containing protein [Bacteroidaceae bacterium]|nr:T9SS type A sorting domain-containing protein [Bacteroidaceae bacterium]
MQKVREIRGNMNIRPTVADRNEEITITLNDEDDTERELIITGVNGQLVERRAINTGENTVKVKAAMMRSGMYNFTIQKRGKVYDNGKVIVK